jgi:hypothetical protein
MKEPSIDHWQAALHVVAYLTGTPNYGLFFASNSERTLVGYSDADFAADLFTRRSTTAYCFIQNGSTVAWKSKLQDTVAVSTTEAEYMAANAAGRTSLWLTQLRNLFNVDPSEKIHILSAEPLVRQKFGQTNRKTDTTLPLINCDSKSAIHLLDYQHLLGSTKHIDVLYHWAREKVQEQRLQFEYIKGTENPADILTKPLPGPAFKHCRDMMGVHDISYRS